MPGLFLYWWSAVSCVSSSSLVPAESKPLPLLCCPFHVHVLSTEPVADHRLHRARRSHLRLCRCSWSSLPSLYNLPQRCLSPLPLPFAIAMIPPFNTLTPSQSAPAANLGAFSLEVPQQRWLLRVGGSTGGVLQHRAHVDISISVKFGCSFSP